MKGVKQLKRFVVAGLFLLCTLTCSAQLVINEVSQGASGSKEYVELVVTGTATCSGFPSVDLRGWYIDDNNGNHATGAGTGIASGCIRFTTDALWSAVPIGTIIVVYNDLDINPLIPPQDLSLSDGNCRLVIPAGNCVLLEQHASQPSIALATYPTTGFSSCGVWTTTTMANGDDSYQTINPSGVMVHAVSWGNNAVNPIIYFAGSSAGMVAWNANTVNTNPALQGNWTRTTVAGNETPGVANNAGNAAWIASMNNNCSPYVALSATGSSTGTCSCTGTGTASPSGGIAPYTFSWAPSGGTNATATSLCPGSYTCTVTDLVGCTQTVTVNVGSQTAPSATLQSSSDALCNGGASGSATVNATGGSGGYTYNWLPSGGTSATASGLISGIYTCTITDSNGCTTTQTVSITQPSAISVTATQTNVSCRLGSDGAASVTASGGIPGYTYNWQPSGGNGASANSLTAGAYTCTITDANGCTTTQSFQITQPGGLSYSSSSSDVLCNGDSNGSANIIVSGGAGGYTYAWSPAGGTSATASGLAAGTYFCVSTDANGCTITATITIAQPALLLSSATSSPAGCAASDGSASVNVSGGTPGYSYSWTPTGGNAATALNLSAGTYTCIITDVNGCTATSSATVGTTGSVPAALVIASGPLAFCQNDSVVLTASGASQFMWSTGDTSVSVTVTVAGTYSVIVTNACGSDTATISVSTIPPPVAVLSASGPTTFCIGDSVTLNASGGTSYLWSNNDTTSSITVNAAGTYLVIVSDACGSDTVSQITNVLPLPTAVITASGPTTFCAGDSVLLTASGGTSYLWSTGDTSASIVATTAGSYTVTSSNGCGTATASQVISISPLPVASITANGPVSFCAGDSVTLTASGGGSYLWSTTSTASSIVVNAAGVYSVTVTNTCGSNTAQQNVMILPAPVALVSASGPTTFCEGSTLQLIASGGTSYQWSTGSNSSSIIVDTAGTYSVIVSNACGGDTAQMSTTILPLPVAQVSGNTLICPGETTTLTATGGGTYTWSTGATTGSIITGAAGSYFVIATNACGSDTAQIIVQPSVVTAGFTATPDSGLVPLTVTFTDGSTNANSWNWNTGTGSSSSANPTETYTTPGTYTVILTVTNADGCQDTATMIIIVADVPGVIEMPNVFTPNGDGINDVFIPYTEGIAEMAMEIYDRWGVMLFRTSNPQEGWDGRASSESEAPDGTYYYIVQASAYNAEVFRFSGHLMLIR